jgi:hypothetical protein
MLKANKDLTPKKIRGNVAILCSSESLSSAEDLINTFSSLNNISLYLEKNNRVSIYSGNPGVLQMKGSNPKLQLECTLKQCFSPLDYSCIICIGENNSFCSIAESCDKYATPVYMLESYAS